jgi:hypothetical protein
MASAEHRLSHLTKGSSGIAGTLQGEARNTLIKLIFQKRPASIFQE